MREIKDLIKRLPYVQSLINFYHLQDRVTYLEKRLHNHRWYAIEQVMEYLVCAQLKGEYCEFGVFKGETFAHGMQHYKEFPTMRYFAFDSFEGLPAPKGLDKEGDYTGNFHEGEFAFSEKDFLNNLKKKNLPLERVITVPGWFDKTLTEETASKHSIHSIAAAWIDCDFYESTVPVLDFLSKRLTKGSIIVYDDWYAFRNSPDRGQQLATKEWLEKNKNIKLAEIFSFGVYGKAFTVAEI